MGSKKVFKWVLGSVLAAALLSAMIALIIKFAPRHHESVAPPDSIEEKMFSSIDNYTLALRKALMFFNAQRSGKLPKDNNVSGRGNSCAKDGEPNTIFKDLSGGFYDAGEAIKFNFPASFAMTMLSWSVIEYSAKYKAAGELQNVKDTIRWGSDYFLKTFDHTGDRIDRVVMQVGRGISLGGFSSEENNHYCWVRPEDIEYDRPVTSCSSRSDLAAEMPAALASASIVFKDNKAYSEKLVHGATTLFKFARNQRGRYSVENEEAI